MGKTWDTVCGLAALILSNLYLLIQIPDYCTNPKVICTLSFIGKNELMSHPRLIVRCWKSPFSSYPVPFNSPINKEEGNREKKKYQKGEKNSRIQHIPNIVVAQIQLSLERASNDKRAKGILEGISQTFSAHGSRYSLIQIKQRNTTTRIVHRRYSSSTWERQQQQQQPYFCMINAS